MRLARQAVMTGRVLSDAWLKTFLDKRILKNKSIAATAIELDLEAL